MGNVMAEFRRVDKPWVPHLDMTLSAGETDALRNLLQDWVRAGKPWDLSSNHQTLLTRIYEQMRKPGGPVA
jgi:hypothetical protein